MLISDYEIPLLLIGLSANNYDIDYGTNILDQFSHSPYYIWEGEVAGGGLFSYLLLSESTLLGPGCTYYLRIAEYDDVGLSSEEFHFNFSVFVSLSIVIADLPILLGPFFLH
jgi:hypothetical protein